MLDMTAGAMEGSVFAGHLVGGILIGALSDRCCPHPVPNADLNHNPNPDTNTNTNSN